MMENAMEEGDCLSQEESSWNYELDITQLCRICANPNEFLIPIFQGEGLEHELETKITQHLPIKVLESDKLPTNLCYQCASTLIAWHDMVVGCVEADEKLRCLVEVNRSENNIDDKEAELKNVKQYQAEIISDSVHDMKTQNVQVLQMNQDAVTMAEDQETNFMTLVETEKVVVEEEITSIEPELVEEVTSEQRSLSFRNYQIAIWALRDKLVKSRTKQQKQIRIVSNITTTSVKETRPNKEINKEEGSFNQLIEINNDEVYKKSKHKCNICGRLFTRTYDLKRHGLVHLNMDIFENLESSRVDCQESKADRRGLDYMSKTISTFTCEICSRIFKAKDSYERHKRIHTGERPFQCSECSKCFRDSGALTRHTKEVHAKIRNHPCNICNKWFVNRATLEDHFRTHTGERPYVCHQCGVMFKSKAALYQHSKTHTNHLPHVCIYCGKCFRRRQELISHLPIHTNEKTHICEKCGKAFSTRSELQRHIIVHSDEKPFTCLTCGLNFSQKRYLKNHMKSRHGRTEDLQPSGHIPVEHF